MKTRIILALLLVFLSGLVIGFVSGQMVDRWHMRNMVMHGPAQFEGMVTERLARLLDLDADQKRVVGNRVGEAVRQADREFRERGHLMQMRMRRLLEEIRPLLKPEQQVKLDALDVDDLRPEPPRPRCERALPGRPDHPMHPPFPPREGPPPGP